MPSRTYNRGRSRRGASRPHYSWETSTFAPTTVNFGNQVTADLAADTTGSNDQLTPTQALTVVRIIGSLRVNSTAALLSVDWAAGITMIESDAFNANVVPEPQSQPNKWMWQMARSSPPPGAGGSSIQIDLDIKSRRRFPGGKGVLAFIIDNTDDFEQLEFALSVRVLFRLP